MIPPCAQNVLQSFGSADFVTSRTLIPAVARQSEVVSPAMPVPMTRTGQCSRFFILARARGAGGGAQIVALIHAAGCANPVITYDPLLISRLILMMLLLCASSSRSLNVLKP